MSADSAIRERLNARIAALESQLRQCAEALREIDVACPHVATADLWRWPWGVRVQSELGDIARAALAAAPEQEIKSCP